MKDVYLRHRMDKEGYLPVSLIASFNRVQALTQDITFIVQSVKDSEVVEVKDGIKVSTRNLRTTEHLITLLFPPSSGQRSTRSNGP